MEEKKREKKANDSCRNSVHAMQLLGLAREEERKRESLLLFRGHWHSSLIINLHSHVAYQKQLQSVKPRFAVARKLHGRRVSIFSLL